MSSKWWCVSFANAISNIWAVIIFQLSNTRSILYQARSHNHPVIPKVFHFIILEFRCYWPERKLNVFITVHSLVFARISKKYGFVLFLPLFMKTSKFVKNLFRNTGDGQIVLVDRVFLSERLERYTFCSTQKFHVFFMPHSVHTLLIKVFYLNVY